MSDPGAPIARILADRGEVSLAEYMALAAGHPQAGYYRRAAAIGRDGDFVTAPEISQVFGELIGLWAAESWRVLGAPDRLVLVELGPGRGTLMADALRAARVLPGFLAAAELHLVETNARLRAAQAERLGDRVAGWHDGLASVPDGPILVIANEFFDALPIRQLVRTGDGWAERRVRWDAAAGRPAWALSAPSAALARLLPPALADAPAGAVVEVSPAAAAVAGTVAERLRAAGGAALIIDYGYETWPLTPTLQAVRAHGPADPLAVPGSVDLSADVDFAALVAVARRAGIATAGPIGQGRFLHGLGIGVRAARLKAGADAAGAAAIDRAVARLTGEDAMGSLFRALVYWHSPAGAPPVFPA